ncbi:MAG: T9SS type A sorting domain-containing protein, partial [Bacteroidales bacterium]
YSVTWENAPAGNYKITAKAIDNEGKSTFSDIINISVEEEVNLVNQENLSFNIYPNPVTSDLIIELKDGLFDDAYLILYDSHGNSIIKETVKGREHRMNLSDIPEGIYIISLTSKQGNIVRKFVKQ